MFRLILLFVFSVNAVASEGTEEVNAPFCGDIFTSMAVSEPEKILCALVTTVDEIQERLTELEKEVDPELFDWHVYNAEGTYLGNMVNFTGTRNSPYDAIEKENTLIGLKTIRWNDNLTIVSEGILTEEKNGATLLTDFRALYASSCNPAYIGMPVANGESKDRYDSLAAWIGDDLYTTELVDKMDEEAIFKFMKGVCRPLAKPSVHAIQYRLVYFASALDYDLPWTIEAVRK